MKPKKTKQNKQFLGAQFVITPIQRFRIISKYSSTMSNNLVKHIFTLLTQPF